MQLQKFICVYYDSLFLQRLSKFERFFKKIFFFFLGCACSIWKFPQVQLGFDPWSGNFHMPWMLQKKKKKNKKYHALCMGMRWGKEQIDILAKSVQIKGFESDCSNSSCSRTETPSTSFMFTGYITLNHKDTVTCLRLAQ